MKMTPDDIQMQNKLHSFGLTPDNNQGFECTKAVSTQHYIVKLITGTLCYGTFDTEPLPAVASVCHIEFSQHVEGSQSTAPA